MIIRVGLPYFQWTKKLCILPRVFRDKKSNAHHLVFLQYVELYKDIDEVYFRECQEQ